MRRRQIPIGEATVVSWAPPSRVPEEWALEPMTAERAGLPWMRPAPVRERAPAWRAALRKLIERTTGT